MEKKPYYITTAIAYTSGKPHIGNLYEIVLADALARFMRLYGYDVRFQTGTDEHGQKIQDKAAEAGVSPKEFVDTIAAEVKRNWDLMNISYDRFVRTTDPAHEKKIQKMFKRLYDKGDIYKGEYEGMYCKPCESFFTQSQLIDGKCPDCGRDVEYAKEEAYFFKLSKYAKRLEEYIEAHPDFIQPESRKNEMLNNFIRPGLKDLCVSRTSFSWGIPVDFDPGHVVYVWIDALSNYITFAGWDPDGNHTEEYKRFWPADIHLIGKDILRFHTIYWPIMLMALNEELPKMVFGHPWLIVGDGKMSKSKGNVIYADELTEDFGLDAVRYYLLKEMPFAQDGMLTNELLIERINGELVNIIGNLVNRTLAMAEKYFGGIVPEYKDPDETDIELAILSRTTPVMMAEKLHEMKISDAVVLLLNLARRANKYIDETAPWVLFKTEEGQKHLPTVIYSLLETIRVIGVLIEPFLPDTGKKILEMLNTKNTSYASTITFGNLESGIRLNKAEILFARIDEEAKLKEIEEKRNKKAEEAAQTENSAAKPEAGNPETDELISIDDFAKVKLVTGKIISAEKHPDAKKLLVFKVDTGERIRTIVSGIAKHFTPEELVGKQVVVVANLKPAELRGVISEGMLLLSENNGTMAFVSPEADMPAGSEVR